MEAVAEGEATGGAVVGSPKGVGARRGRVCYSCVLKSLKKAEKPGKAKVTFPLILHPLSTLTLGDNKFSATGTGI